MSRIRTRATVAVAGFAALAVALPAAATAKTDGPTASAAARAKITMSGSTSVAPLAALLARGYIKQYPHRAKFSIAQGGSDVGIADVARGRVSIGNSSRDPKATDPGGIFFNKIARDAVCVATHPSNTVGNLSAAQVQGIFSGTIKKWSSVEGSTKTGDISIVVRTAASGTQDFFQKSFMGSKKIASSAAQKSSNGLVAQAIKSDENAIGYISLDFANGTNPVPYEGVACNLRNAKSGQYLGTRNFWMVTLGRATGAVDKFISWIQRSPKAQAIVSKHWVPIT